jgi:hypothetical protein
MPDENKREREKFLRSCAVRGMRARLRSHSREHERR